jgi:DNA-binding LacI/PurR family transcriptional regulator/signal transduction histidine kinase
MEKTIGVVIPVYKNTTITQTLDGTVDAAKKYGAKIICFQGFACRDNFESSSIDHYDPESTMTFQIISESAIDGLVVFTGNLKSYEIKQKLISKCKEMYPSIPIVYVGAAMDGVTNVLVENNSGVDELMDHLVHEHHYSRFVYIRGPLDNNDAEERFRYFMQYLNRNGINPDNTIVSEPGPWLENRTYQYIKTIQPCIATIDCIVCASDLLALGVLKALKEHNVNVPGDVAVVGFNDNTFAQMCFPPLTTVTLSTYERGYKAIELIMDTFDGQVLPSNCTVISKAVFRQSCGCQSSSVKALATQITTDICLKSLDDKQTRRQSIDSLFKNATISIVAERNKEMYQRVITSLVELTMLQIESPDNQLFLKGFNSILCSFVTYGDCLDCWNRLLVIIKKVLAYCKCFRKENELDDIMLEAHLMVTEVEALSNAISMKSYYERKAAIYTMNYGLNKIHDLATIMELTANNLQQLGIPGCYICLYEEVDNPLIQSRLVLAYNYQGRITLPQNGILFPTKELVPSSINHAMHHDFLIVEPLYYEEQRYGYAIFEMAKADRAFYEDFAAQLSATLWGTKIYEKEKSDEAVLNNQALELENKNKELLERNESLMFAYKQLQENREKILISDKMAAIGRLTSGIVTEMSTPLQVLHQSLDKLEEVSGRLKKLLQKSDSNYQIGLAVVGDIIGFANEADNAAMQAADYIRSIKVQTRKTNENEIQKFDVNEIVFSVLVFLGHLIKIHNCKVDTSLQDDVLITGSPSKMTQILTTLIMNSIDALKGRDNAVITIVTKSGKDKCNLEITDNGCGIAPEHINRVFEPMFSTKPDGTRTGIGLSLVKSIVCGEFGGTITVESTPGIGTSFKLEFKPDHAST